MSNGCLNIYSTRKKTRQKQQNWTSQKCETKWKLCVQAVSHFKPCRYAELIIGKQNWSKRCMLRRALRHRKPQSVILWRPFVHTMANLLFLKNHQRVSCCHMLYLCHGAPYLCCGMPTIFWICTLILLASSWYDLCFICGTLWKWFNSWIS